MHMHYTHHYTCPVLNTGLLDPGEETAGRLGSLPSQNRTEERKRTKILLQSIPSQPVVKGDKTFRGPVCS